jgi:hypothetical protein
LTSVKAALRFWIADRNTLMPRLLTPINAFHDNDESVREDIQETKTDRER